ncbi:MAG: hypothetical protein WC980_03220 [Candidatus Brocadiia bacterium]
MERIETRFIIAAELVLLCIAAGPAAAPLEEINNLKAAYNAGKNIIDISGKAEYPDGAMLFTALDYSGQRLLVTRTAVAGKRFTVSLAPGKKLLPAYYQIEVSFIPNRQEPANRNFPARVEELSIAVGSTEAIDRERESSLLTLANITVKLNAFYKAFIYGYEQKMNDSSKFDLTNWRGEYKEIVKTIKSFSTALDIRRQEYLIALWPDLESRTEFLADELATIYEEMTEHLKNSGNVLDPHTGQKMPFETLKTLFYERFYSRHKPLAADLQLHQCLPNEYQVINRLKTIRDLYRECRTQYTANIPKMGQPDEWRKFSEEWDKRAQVVKSEMNELTKGLNDLEKSFPDFYRNLTGLADALINLHKEYNSHIGIGLSPVEGQAQKHLQAIQQAEQRFKAHLAGILDQLGCPGLANAR